MIPDHASTRSAKIRTVRVTCAWSRGFSAGPCVAKLPEGRVRGVAQTVDHHGAARRIVGWARDSVPVGQKREVVPAVPSRSGIAGRCNALVRRGMSNAAICVRIPRPDVIRGCRVPGNRVASAASVCVLSVNAPEQAIVLVHARELSRSPCGRWSATHATSVALATNSGSRGELDPCSDRHGSHPLVPLRPHVRRFCATFDYPLAPQPRRPVRHSWPARSAAPKTSRCT